MNIPIDILILIFNHLIIIDQRSWIRCNKQLNQLNPLIKKSEKEFLKFIHASNFISYKKIHLNKCEMYALESVYYGRKDILEKYLEKKETLKLFTENPLLYYNMAVRNMDICKKIYEEYKSYGSTNCGSIMNAAASTGNLELVKWIYTKGCPTGCICDCAALHGHLKVLKWARKKRAGWDTRTFYNAALNGHLEVLKYLCENGCPQDVMICAGAATNGHLEVLKYLREQRFLWNSETCASAASNGHLEVLKWARENGCSWSESTCFCAARNGHLDVLKWARENGCPWNNATCYNAARNGHLEVLKWARENGCNWCEDTCYQAVNGGHLEVLKWARENGCPWYNNNLCNDALAMNRLEVFKWLQKNGCPWDTIGELRRMEYNKNNVERRMNELNNEKKQLWKREKKLMKFIHEINK